MIKTKGIWTNENAILAIPLSTSFILDAANKGKTDGTVAKTWNQPVEGQHIVWRTWSDTESAQAWIDFINTLDIKPESYEIVVE